MMADANEFIYTSLRIEKQWKIASHFKFNKVFRSNAQRIPI